MHNPSNQKIIAYTVAILGFNKNGRNPKNKKINNQNLFPAPTQNLL